MVDEQKADSKLVGKLLEDTKLGVVTTVGNLGRGRADELEGVDGYEGHLRVLTLEITEPIADSAFDGGASRSEIHPVGNVVRDGVQALLDPPLAVFQAEVTSPLVTPSPHKGVPWATWTQRSSTSHDLPTLGEPPRMQSP